MSRSGGQFEAKPSVFLSQIKLGTHLSTHFNRDEKLNQLCPANTSEVWAEHVDRTPDIWRESAIRSHWALI
ncbi:hypothetical protein TNCV_1021991 [Trichonephila clavipes]|nr:hypothetical protein TNCV_1021991 [Trichonephila clavipes]